MWRVPIWYGAATSEYVMLAVKLAKDFDGMTPEYTERAAFGGSGNERCFKKDLK